MAQLQKLRLADIVSKQCMSVLKSVLAHKVHFSLDIQMSLAPDDSGIMAVVLMTSVQETTSQAFHPILKLSLCVSLFAVGLAIC